MILVDKEINKFVKKINLIKPFNEEQLTPNGYDVSVNKDTSLFPKQPYIVVSRETIKLPDNIVAQPWLKQKYARQGIHASLSMIDAGFEGTLALSLYNSSQVVVSLKKGDAVAQVVFHQLHRPVGKKYLERSGNYQYQKEQLIK